MLSEYEPAFLLPGSDMVRVVVSVVVAFSEPATGLLRTKWTRCRRSSGDSGRETSRVPVSDPLNIR